MKGRRKRGIATSPVESEPPTVEMRLEAARSYIATLERERDAAQEQNRLYLQTADLLYIAPFRLAGRWLRHVLEREFSK